MKEVTLLTVGKLKEKSLLEFEHNYLKRISTFKFKIIELKSMQENKDAEATLVLKKIADLSPEKKEKTILLTERGTLKNSIEFSDWLFSIIENTNKIFFIIAGAAGHGDELISQSDYQFSLSPLTYPHQLARVLLVEQIYRAQTINNRHPYHK